MRGEDKLTAIGDLAGPPEVIQRMDLLARRFSPDEIERLAKWQIRCRMRPDGLDVPVTVSRLRFARWLFEHGRIGEDFGADPEGLDVDPACESPPQGARAVSLKYMPPRYWDPQFRHGGTRREHGEGGYPPLLSMVSRLRARLTKLAATLREPERPACGTGGGDVEASLRDPRSQADTWRLWSGLY